MSDGINRVYIGGNLTADPEFRVTKSGGGVLNLRVATNESYLNSEKVRQEKTEYHSVTIWGPRGEALAKILAKGNKVFVEGSLRTTSYEKNGEKRYKTEIVASNIMLGGGKSDGAQPAQRSLGSPKIADAEFEDEIPV